MDDGRVEYGRSGAPIQTLPIGGKGEEGRWKALRLGWYVGRAGWVPASARTREKTGDHKGRPYGGEAGEGLGLWDEILRRGASSE